MKNVFSTALISLIAMVGYSAEFDSTVHFQMGVNSTEETSYMKMTGNLYDPIPDSPLVWVISPKIYLNASVPVDFSLSAGVKLPTDEIVYGYHAFGHFHNFGDFPVNQYGHTFEALHDRWEAKINYYQPANGVYPLSSGILSSHRVDSEFTFKVCDTCFTVGPIYQIQDQSWGLLSRVAVMLESADVGIEIHQPPGGVAMTSLFTTFKFPNKNKGKVATKGNSSSHYTNIGIEGPTSYSSSIDAELVKRLKAFNSDED